MKTALIMEVLKVLGKGVSSVAIHMTLQASHCLSVRGPCQTSTFRAPVDRVPLGSGAYNACHT